MVGLVWWHPFVVHDWHFSIYCFLRSLRWVFGLSIDLCYFDPLDFLMFVFPYWLYDFSWINWIKNHISMVSLIFDLYYIKTILGIWVDRPYFESLFSYISWMSLSFKYMECSLIFLIFLLSRQGYIGNIIILNIILHFKYLLKNYFDNIVKLFYYLC